MAIHLFIAKCNRVTECILTERLPLIQDEDLYYACSQLRIDVALQVLRFGKRYTLPLSEIPESAQNKIIDEFLRRNRRNSRINLCERIDGDYAEYVPNWLATELQRIGREIFRAARVPYHTNRTLEGDLHNLPNGVTADGFRLPFEKWCSVHASYGYYDPYITAGIRHYNLDDDLWYVPSVLRLVPKDSRGPRLIMEEPLERTLRQTIISDYLMKVISKPSFSRYAPDHAILLDDQKQNAYLAKLGSEDRSLCTIDLSNASDSITAKLVVACFPSFIAKDILAGCSHRVLLPDGRIVRLYMPMTMGSRVTPPGQSLINWIIISAAYDYGRAHGMVSEHSLMRCSVYNDDIIVPLDMYDIVVEFLTVCGLIVNDDKSFAGDSPFRESCGVDAWDGQIVTSIYWPRKELQASADYLPSWIALHNRLYDAGMRGAAAYLSTVIDGILPGVPRVLPDSREIGIKSMERLSVTKAYMRHDWNVFVCVTPYELPQCASNGALHKFETARKVRVNDGRTPNAALLHFSTNEEKSGLIHIQTWEEYYALLEPYSYLAFDDGSRVWYPKELLKHDLSGRIKDRFDQYPVDGFYTITTNVLRQTYSNAMSRTCFDRNIVNEAMLDYLWEDYMYNHSLLYGPEYYDELCEYLHITSPRNLRKTQVATSYKIRKQNYTAADPGVVKSAEEHFLRKLHRLNADSAHSAIDK